MKRGELPYTFKPADRSAKPEDTPASKNRPGHSSGVVAVDRWGNVAAVTHSINTAVWGNTGIFVDGVSIPDSASFQQQEIKRVGPGHRLPEPMNPLIIVRRPSNPREHGHWRRAAPALHSGSRGRARVRPECTGCSRLACFRFTRMDWLEIGAQVPQGSFDKKVLDGVRSLGQEIKELDLQQRAMFIGYWAGIVLDPRSRLLRGAGTKEQPSYAEGY